mmetsp:Transcript_10970/g.16462  ORF Transcript_10970/g.16462 Transcript_10970/m.16462 type:complete len:304 (+) Transcript_10970:566-1477(+)
MHRRRRVHRPDNSFDLTHDPLLLISIVSDKGKSSTSLSIESEILCKTLSQHYIVSLLNKVSQSKSICLGISRSESLVSRIEEYLKVLLLDQRTNSLPLLLRRIASSRIVSTSVKKNNSAFRSSLKILEHTIKVQSISSTAVVSVTNNFQSAFLKDGNVVPPGRIRNVNFLHGEVPGEELSSNTTSSSSTESLCSCNNREIGILSIRELDGLFDVSYISHNARILFVFGRIIHHNLFCRLDRWQNPWLSIFITVSSDANVDLVGICALLKVIGNSENGVGSSHGDVSEVGFCSSHGERSCSMNE